MTWMMSKMMRNLCLFVAGLLLAASLSAPLSGQVSINTNLTTGTMTTGVANLYRTAYLHFQLVNCGDNIPVMPGQSNAVVQDSFDLRPATPGSAIVGQIIGNDQITCGNVISTYYEVTAMKDASHPLRDGIPYVICSASASISTCGNAASLGTFNIITADPMSQPPPVPGFTEIYGNPSNSQTINQPVNGIAGWTGASTSFSLTNGMSLGPVPFSELSLLTGFATMVIVSDAMPGSNPCTGGSTGALAVYVNGAWNCNQGAGLGSGTVTGFLAPSGSWPSWLVPTVTNASTVPDLTVAAGPIPNAALANSSLTVTAGAGLAGGGSVSLGGSTSLNIANGGVTNAMLVNPSMTVDGTTCTLGGTCTPSAGGGGNPTLDNCTPDETGNSFPTVTSLTNYFLASWQFVFSTTTYFNCTVYVPTAQAGATVVVDVWSSDSTAGHTALITYADGVINSGTMNIGSLTTAANQTFTTTSTANNRVTKTFNVQSTLSNGSILVIQIGTAPTGTAPTANINVYPHFVL
jgi:hypothetical protein